MAEHPVNCVEQVDAYRTFCDRLRREEPLIADNSVDLIVSNCVLNLVRTDEKAQLFREMHRVLKPGGRVVISDIVCDEDPTPEIFNDPHLWSGCIAGAFREDRFLDMFEEAGFYGIEILQRQEEPWQTIDGIEFRAMTVRAYKGKEGPCLERKQAVIYSGPWKHVCDDDGHVLHRGQRMAVCDKTYRIMTDLAGPYAGQIVGVDPLVDIPLDHAEAFDCKRGIARHPRVSKGMDYRETRPGNGSGCGNDGSCC
jgi:hypothetical protein